MTISEKVGLNNQNILQAPIGTYQVSEDLSIPCWYANPFAYALKKPFLRQNNKLYYKVKPGKKVMSWYKV